MLRDKLLREIQSHIPLVKRPFAHLADRLGVSEEEVIEELRKLKEEKIVRQISPIYDTRAVGYDSSLVAFRVDPSRMEEVAKLVNTHPGVSHNYEREHRINLWFTLAVPPDGELSLEDTVSLLAEAEGVEEYFILRTLRTFKIGVRLNYDDPFERERVRTRESGKVPLNPLEKKVIRVSQKDLPLVRRPFLELSRRVGVSESELLEILRRLKEKGVMRRFSAILFHRRVGFKANGMAVWRVPEDRIEEIGRYLASFRGVSHCYERSTCEGWSYNLFSMVHGRSREEVLSFVEKVGGEIGIEDREVLFSRREFKKRRIELFSEEFYEWEKERVGLRAH